MTDRPERNRPESLRLRAAIPSLTVQDINHSLEWYSQVLGFTVEERMEHEGTLVGASLKAGEVRIYLGQDDFALGRDRTKGEGMRFFLTTVQDVRELADEVLARGGTLAEGPQQREWGTTDFTVVDPDGFRLTITEPYHQS